ncbi:DUF1844 domain-containing protein [Desulfomonile tiedjei]|uniref:DUF1844 domain-containing protein n=1 Tax=Desulfomonile tiedjei (strain ATCC 49306 / DSM 6799 / DCB-1) TaxID=706587 RepID=I4CA71_DESTA|nr:DUF1844 domain-containing protein [Desulfomonile tiedjei]AFM26462.1 protein of unknown function (DUF1844) [Desulfomonile tiedjei DSM 6799]
MDESEKSEFTIRDKRRFTTEGESKATSADKEPETPPEQPKTEAPSEKPADRKREREYQPLDFNSFVLSLANTALLQMGMIKFPDSETERDLFGARQTIDLLALLQDKTRGNLSDQEQKVLNETLFQLRIAFVEAAKEK